MTATGKALRAASVVLALMASVFLQGCGDVSSSKSGAPMTAADIDKECAADLADKMMTAEAKEWLDDNKMKNMLVHAEKAPARTFVTQLYEAGCPKVSMVKIGHAGGNQVCSTIVAELPTAPAQRKKAFDTIAAYWNNNDLPRMIPTDTGQTYYRFNPI